MMMSCTSIGTEVGTGFTHAVERVRGRKKIRDREKQAWARVRT